MEYGIDAIHAYISYTHIHAHTNKLRAYFQNKWRNKNKKKKYEKEKVLT